mmetsp:Transcript_84376/g.243519  ORF Transcript_84376/g.243519 Transcript_84376/m.243519 type:complete len:129 (+) Transcript_84376:45-431(+)
MGLASLALVALSAAPAAVADDTPGLPLWFPCVPRSPSFHCDYRDRVHEERATESVVKGVKNRPNANDCCCREDQEIMWDDPPMLHCQERSKCLWVCCEHPDKLCGEQCCTQTQKCIHQVCVNPVEVFA